MSVGPDHLLRVFEWAPGFICILTGPDHVVSFVNRKHRALFGSDDWVGRPAREAVPEVGEQGFHALLDRVYATGERVVGTGLPVRFHAAPGGAEVTLFHDFVYEPIRDEEGRVTGIFCEGFDVSEAYRARDALERLAERQAFRLEVERALAGAASGRAAILATATLIAARTGAEEVAFVENARAFSGSVCRRVLRRGATALAETLSDSFPLPPDALACLAADRTVREDGLLLSPQVGAGELTGYLEVRAAGLGAWPDEEVALIAEVARRTWEVLDRVRAAAERDRFFDGSLDLLAVGSMSDGRIRRASRSFERVLGWTPEELVGVPSLDLVHPDDRAAAAEAAPALQAGRPLRDHEQRVRCKDGSYRWISWSTTPDPAEGVIYGVGRDVTDRKEFERHRDVFIAELNHRVKNTLAVVQAIASQTFRSEGLDPAAAVARYQNRISAISAAHDVLTDGNWGAPPIRAIVASVLRLWPRLAPRVEVAGPDLAVTPRQGIALALALNELLANAAAHGALGTPAGRARIAWEGRAGGAFALEWRESGGPGLSDARHRGFGTRYLASLGEEFEGTAAFAAEDGAVVYRIEGRAGEA